jgi:two-component system chemotaxis sensor kinase CheA
MPTSSVQATRGKFLVAGQSNRIPALLVRDGDQSVAFAIDRIVSQQQIVVRPLSDQLEGLQGLQGCTILGDGEPGVILSLPDLARSYFLSVGRE